MHSGQNAVGIYRSCFEHLIMKKSAQKRFWTVENSLEFFQKCVLTGNDFYEVISVSKHSTKCWCKKFLPESLCSALAWNCFLKRIAAAFQKFLKSLHPKLFNFLSVFSTNEIVSVLQIIVVIKSFENLLNSSQLHML